jgi:glucose/arabinose dehydrogenase
MIRHRRPRFGSVVLAAALAAGVGTAPAAVGGTARPEAETGPAPAALAAGQLQLKFIDSGLSQPIGITNAGDGSNRLFIVQRRGLVRVVKNNALQAGSFMNISSKVSQSGSERGLLGLAFDPDFETNRRLFVFYTMASGGDIIISRFLADPGLETVNEGSEALLLRIEHSQYGNHNGGQLAFGPDGFLYAAVGDGGHFGDPYNSGQRKDTLLGKILRIDPDGTGAGPYDRYSVPASNPFVGEAGFDEIWDYGLRNPWRFSFDRETDNLWIADVGQNNWEEINRESGSSAGGVNYGWDDMEGKHCYESGCSSTGKMLPIAEYSHSDGCSVTGGYVYRGTTQLDLVGNYVLADYCSGRVWTISAGSSALTQRLDTSLAISSFGESETGELYAVDLGGGRLYRVVAPEFSDILASSFIDDIHWLLYEGITFGCGGMRYCPRDPVTRAEMASFLTRVLDLPPSPTDYFTDDETSLHEGAINSLAQAGITGGCASNQYCPGRNVLRGEMATFLVRALDIPPTATDYFTDDESSSHEANINALRAAGLTAGCSATTYCPNASVTREQMAAFLHRAFD